MESIQEGDAIARAVALMRTLDDDGKLSYLQRTIGGEARNKLELEWRARLLTALRAADVWPSRSSCW